MSEVVRKNLYFIQLLTKSPSVKQLRGLLQNITDEQLKALSEIAVNVLYGTIPLTKKTKEKLKPYKSFLTLLSDKKKSLKQKRFRLSAKLSVLQLLLRTVLPFLQSVL